MGRDAVDFEPSVALDDQAAFDLALAALARIDAALVATVRDAGAVPRLRRRPSGFEGLAWIVTGQQLSTASAEAIFARVRRLLGTIDRASLEAAADADLRACGLSAGKVATLRAVAAAERAGALDFTTIGTMPADAAHAALVAIRGIGPWTADVFLLFCLGHADAWPAGDLALREAAKLALGLDTRPDAGRLRSLGEAWRPYRGVAAHCLWAYYHVARGKTAPDLSKER